MMSTMPVMGEPSESTTYIQGSRIRTDSEEDGRTGRRVTERAALPPSYAWSRAHAATSAWVANQTSPSPFAMRMISSRIQIRER